MNSALLRRALGSFATGVTIVTTCDQEGRPRGMTANSFTSVSLDPPLVLVCISRSAASFEAFATTASFAANVLHEGQAALSSLFASKTPNKFQSVDHVRRVTGAPILSESLAWFDCSVHSRIDAGDHLVLIGRVETFEARTAAPLGFSSGRYVSFREMRGDGGPPLHDVAVSFLLETADAVLLRPTGDGRWSLPSAQHRRADLHVTLEDGQALDLAAASVFLYSVFDETSGPGNLVYRARLAEPAAIPRGLMAFALDRLPYDQLASPALGAVLRRFERERRAGRFGVYVDSDDDGHLAMIDGDFDRLALSPFDRTDREHA